MRPSKSLPHSDDFARADDYIDSLLTFVTTSQLFQTLCGGVHILDFLTQDESSYSKVIPQEWQSFLLSISSSSFLDLMIRDDLTPSTNNPVPKSLAAYICQVRRHCLIRTVQNQTIQTNEPPKLSRHVVVGMIPKKVHEVSTFASYVSGLMDSLPAEKQITHIIDFGSGQNYLGRALASPPYNHHIIAVESRTVNMKGAKNMDVLARIAKREPVIRNKKLFLSQWSKYKEHQRDGKVIQNGNAQTGAIAEANASAKLEGFANVDLRPVKDIETIFKPPEEGKGYVQYVQRRLSNGDLSDVIEKFPAIETTPSTSGDTSSDIETVSPSASLQTSILAVSLHSCGNLSHHGIRSLVLNPSIEAIAITGCCYNLLTASLPSPASYQHKHPLLRPDLRAINSFDPIGNTNCTSQPQKEAVDVHGFPMSERVKSYGDAGEGVRFNIASRSMAVQAPANWTASDSENFFERHFWRALLQRIFLDYGVVKRIHLGTGKGEGDRKAGDYATQPLIVGTLSKSCFKQGFKGYLKGALERLISRTEDEILKTQLLDMQRAVSDDVIRKYEEEYNCRKQELSIVWSLMAFSAQVVESVIVVDRWSYLREHIGEGAGKIRDAWVEAIFDYKLSPRNLVVVGVK